LRVIADVLYKIKKTENELGMRNQTKHPANPIWYNLSQKRWNTCQLEETDSPHFPIELKERNLKSMNKKMRIQNKPAANRPRTASVERKR